MKLLHMSDLHIGKNLNGFSLLEDQVHVLKQIVRFVRLQTPQAVLICGDIYDKPAPGVEAVRVFDQFLTELAQEGVSVLIISGNHDSSERLSFASRIMEKQNVYISGSFAGELGRVSLADEFGEVTFYLLPFIKPSYIKRFFPEKKIENCDDAVKAVIEAACIDARKRNVLLAHQFLTPPGGEPERSDSEVGTVGGLDSVEIAAVQDLFDYVALGHLHGAQAVGREHICYAGSPLKYSFSEYLHEKSVTLVELGEKGQLTIDLLPLTPRRDLRKIRGPLEELVSQGVFMAEGAEDYLQVTLTDEEEVLDPIGKIRSVYPNVMVLHFENDRTTSGPVENRQQFAEDAPPLSLFEGFFLSQYGRALQPEEAALVRRLLAEIEVEV